MTPPVPPDPQTARPSTAVIAISHTEVVLNTILSKCAALVGLVVFSHLTWVEAKSAMPSNVRLALVAVPAVVAFAMLTADLMTATIKSVGGALMPLVTAWKGGK